MEIILIILGAIAICLIIFALMKIEGSKSENKEEHTTELPPKSDVSVKIEATLNGKEIFFDDEYRYDIAGINYRHLDDSYLGNFEGTVIVEPDNEYDPLAIAIYLGKKKVGYLSRKDNYLIHEKLEKIGGKTHCSGYIDKATEDGRSYYYGRINIEWDINNS